MTYKRDTNRSFQTVYWPEIPSHVLIFFNQGVTTHLHTYIAYEQYKCDKMNSKKSK